MSDTLQAAVMALQDAQQTLEQAIHDLVNHNIAEDAHLDIRALIQKLTDTDAIYTREEIEQLIEDQLAQHADTDFKTAHPGWEEYSTALDDALSALTERVVALEQWRHGIETGTGQTDLQAELQRIEDKYAPVLSDLYASLQVQKDLGNTEAVASITKIIEQTLNQKTQEILTAMETYGTSPYSIDDPTVRITCVYHPNGGTGHMAATTTIKGDTITLPICTYTPPTGQVFAYWSTSPHGVGAHMGQEGHSLDITSITTSTTLTLYAIWRSDPSAPVVDLSTR